MAKLKARLTKEAWEKLPEAEKALYAPMDNGSFYVPDVEAVDGWGLENIHGLKSAYEKAMGDKRDLEKRLRDGGPDAELTKQLETVKAELEAIKKADPSGKADARVADAEKAWKARFDEDQKKWDSERQKLRTALDQRVRRVELQNALASKKARPERISHLVALAEGRVRMVENADGSFSAQVVKSDGSVEYSRRTGKLTEAMTLDELADEFSNTLPEMFQGHDARGTGASSSTGVGGSGGAFTMLASAVRSDPRAYKAMSEKAAAAGKTVTVTEG